MMLTNSIPNSFVMQGPGLKPLSKITAFDPDIYLFIDEATETNLIFVCRDGFTWEVRDGRATVDKTYWIGRLHWSREITSLLIQFSGNASEAVKI